MEDLKKQLFASKRTLNESRNEENAASTSSRLSGKPADQDLVSSYKRKMTYGVYVIGYQEKFIQF